MRHRPCNRTYDLREDDQSEATIRPDDTRRDDFQTSHDDPDELSDTDVIDLDDERWEAFLADEDELDPDPEPGDFWPDDD